MTCLGTPLRFKPLTMDLWDTMSNSFARSIKTILYSFLFRRWFLMSCCKVLTFSKQPSTGTKPFCLISNLVFFLNRLSQILAYNRMNKLPMVIGCQFEEFVSSSTDFGIKVVRHCLTLSGILCRHHLLRIAALSSNVNNFKSANVIS